MARGGAREGAGRPVGTKLAPGDAMSTCIYIRYKPEQAERLRQAAKEAGFSLSGWVRKLLDDELARLEKEKKFID